MNALRGLDRVHDTRTLDSILSKPERASSQATELRSPAAKLANMKLTFEKKFAEESKQFANILNDAGKLQYAEAVHHRLDHLQKTIFEPLNAKLSARDFNAALNKAAKQSISEGKAALSRLKVDAARIEMVESSKKPDLPAAQLFKTNDGKFSLIRKAPPIENLVLRGGGAKGISTGAALEQFELSGQFDQLKHISGSSAGALTASCMACGVSASQLDKVESETLFKAGVANYFKGSSKPYPDLKFAESKISAKALNSVRTVDESTASSVKTYLDTHWNTEAFQRKLDQISSEFSQTHHLNKDDVTSRLASLRDKPDFGHARSGKMITFRDLSLLHQLAPDTFRQLTLTAWDGPKKEPVYFNAENTPDIPICYAARSSMSFPVAFAPVMLDLKDGKGERTLLDGGIGSNLPAEVFLEKEPDISAVDANPNEQYALKQTKTMLFTFDRGGEAYQFMATKPSTEAPRKNLKVRVANWLLKKDISETNRNDHAKLWHAGPNAVPIFHGGISTLTAKISDKQANAARLQAASEALEQIKARQNQAYYLQYDTLDEAIAAMSQEERAAVLADTDLERRLSAVEIAKLKNPAATSVSARPSNITDYA